MKYCKSCGRQLEDQDMFCDRCGRPHATLEWRRSEPPVTTTVDVSVAGTERTEQSHEKSEIVTRPGSQPVLMSRAYSFFATFLILSGICAIFGGLMSYAGARGTIIESMTWQISYNYITAGIVLLVLGGAIAAFSSRKTPTQSQTPTQSLTIQQAPLGLRYHESEISVASPFSRVVDAIPRVASKMNWRIQEENRVRGYFAVSVGTSLWAWGQTFLIDVTSLDEKTTKIKVSNAVYDVWGKTRRDTETFFRELENCL